MPASQYYQSLKDRGICVYCSRVPASTNSLFCEPCREKNKKAKEKYQQTHKREQAVRMHDWYVRTRSVRALVSKETAQKLKREIISAYGDKCKCCGVSEIVFLDIDHINNDGARHREELKRAGRNFYGWLKRNHFPPGFQVLCKNCNWAKYVLGRCPHERTQLSATRTAA